MGLFKGEPATSELVNPEQVQPPSQDAALWFWNTIFPQLIGTPMQSYPGQINPGLAPYMRDVMQMGSAYAQGANPMNQPGNPHGALRKPGLSVPMPPDPGIRNPGTIDPWFNKGG